MRFGKGLLWYLLIIHSLFIGMGLYFFKDNWAYFVCIELVGLLSLAVGFRLYRHYRHTLKLVESGVESIRNKDFHVKYVKTGQSDLDELIDVYNVMIDQLREERIVQTEKSHLLHRLTDAMMTGIFWLDFDGCFEMINPAAEKILGQDKKVLLGKHLTDFQGPFFDWLKETHRSQGEKLIQIGQKKYKCYQAHFIDRGFKKRYVLMEDISAELLETEKQAYGKVVRMMSHEVNNSSGAVNSILESILKHMTADQSMWKEALEVCVKRNQNLALFMRNFAEVVRLPAPVKERVDMKKWLEQLFVFQRSIFESASIELELDAKDALFVSIDVQQMEQVLLNVLKNSYEAILLRRKKEAFQGKVKITLDKAKQQLVIMDNGIGLSSTAQKHQFQAFYSTKKQGQGIGLTLSRDILSAHQFAFDLRSNNTAQTFFTISFQTEK